MPCKIGVTGMGVISAIGQGKPAFLQALLEGKTSFGIMQRPGRQKDSTYLGAEIREIAFPAEFSKRTLRAASLTAQVALVALEEAWAEAHLSSLDPRRVGLVVGGSNVQQRELMRMREEHDGRPEFLRPSYALSFMDSDVCGFCTAQFGIRGPAYTVGGASASGQLAVIRAAQAVRSREVDVCIALGALMDLSHWECQGMRLMGAMGSDRFASEPELACRPFDQDHDGFIFGECCGAVVLESIESSERRGREACAELAGWGIGMDANRNPNPSLEGEIHAICMALQASGWQSAEVDYINPHGTGSVAGDETELLALRQCALTNAPINATKSLVGHGLTAAGTVEVIATLLQMKAEQLHPTRNLEKPMDTSLPWVREHAVRHVMNRALTLSLGFGGINTALCWQRIAG